MQHCLLSWPKKKSIAKHKCNMPLILWNSIYKLVIFQQIITNISYRGFPCWRPFIHFYSSPVHFTSHRNRCHCFTKFAFRTRQPLTKPTPSQSKDINTSCYPCGLYKTSVAASVHQQLFLFHSSLFQLLKDIKLQYDSNHAVYFPYILTSGLVKTWKLEIVIFIGPFCIQIG